LGETQPPVKFDPKHKQWVEIWNDVFMEYTKTKDGRFLPLHQKNVDTGLGVERVTMVLQGKKTVFDTELFQPIFAKISKLGKIEPTAKNIISFRIIADHMRAATFILGDERSITPGNVDQGYILRRYIRRTIRHGKKLGLPDGFCNQIAAVVITAYKKEYPLLEEKKVFILAELQKEEEKFEQTLEKGLKEFAKMSTQRKISGNDAFLLFQSYGFPLEITEELAEEKGITVDVESYLAEYEKHQQLSRLGAEKKFKGGLSEESPQTIRYHTATHILNEALRKVISSEIKQCGSNITPERLRFDFSFDRKLTAEEIQKVEAEVNRVITMALPVERKEMSKEEALTIGAQMEFGHKYPERVSVYFIGTYSKEFCGGPHVKNTKELGMFRILKEESSSAGVRRIKAVLGEYPFTDNGFNK
ncbi:MAG: alanine--tRNA ligase-related protein, partial [Nanoarchaeota archaeon]|nr:alanine--tRNA ligase-related protein [Nanoarchaeota archaeon]